MKQIIPMDGYGIFCDARDIARADSLVVANVFGKEHKNVIRDIENLDCSAEFNRLNFERIYYRDSMNRNQAAYAMTRDGLVYLVMGYRGKRAAQVKESYIKRFNEMEKTIRAMVAARVQFPLLTENIKLLHEAPKPYHFSNECDMINKLVLGMTAKQYREANGIPHGQSIRPYLAQEQIEQLEMLQSVDIGLLLSVPDFQQRKRMLEWYLQKRLAA